MQVILAYYDQWVVTKRWAGRSKWDISRLERQFSPLKFIKESFLGKNICLHVTRYKIRPWKLHYQFSCTRFQFGASDTFGWIILFPHNFVILNHDKKKISASALLDHGRNNALRSTLISWPYTCNSVLGASIKIESSFGSQKKMLLCHYFKQFLDVLVGPRSLGIRPLRFFSSHLELGWHSGLNLESGCMAKLPAPVTRVWNLGTLWYPMISYVDIWYYSLINNIICQLMMWYRKSYISYVDTMISYVDTVISWLGNRVEIRVIYMWYSICWNYDIISMKSCQDMMSYTCDIAHENISMISYFYIAIS